MKTLIFSLVILTGTLAFKITSTSICAVRKKSKNFNLQISEISQFQSLPNGTKFGIDGECGYYYLCFGGVAYKIYCENPTPYYDHCVRECSNDMRPCLGYACQVSLVTRNKLQQYQIEKFSL